MFTAVYETATGRLESIGTVVADDATLTRKGLAKKEFDFDKSEVGHSKNWNESTQTFDTVTPPKPAITRQAFIDRFTSAELDSIVDAAKTAKRAAGFIEYLKMQDSVRLDAPRIVNSVNDMESAGLIAAGRAAEILDG